MGNDKKLNGHPKKLIVIGGGAAGFFCAVNAARLNPNLQVTILEKTSKLLSKVKVSGGGRCNVTHHLDSITEMAKRYPRGQQFLKKAFHHFFVKDTIQWFTDRQVKLKAEPDGRMFPVTDSSQTIIDCLLNEASTYQVRVNVNTSVEALRKLENGQWELQLQNNQTLRCDYLCVAAGGYATADKFGYLAKIGHTISSPVPSLFTFNMPKNPITALMGVSVPNAQVKIVGTKLQENGPLLITHWGMSGPVILRLSAWGARLLQEKNYDFTAIVNWLPGSNENALREEWPALRQKLSSQKIYNKSPFGLPSRLWHFLLQEAGIAEETRWAEVPGKEQNKLMKLLTSMECPVKGKTTFKEEFVTCGGIDLQEVDSNTFESKLHNNLFFAGEILDIDGITGGFNFQNAWTSGYISAQTIAGRAV
ncbi:hypothetical protein LX64_02443 [Chitinophaga skermanii]|uniref:Flavoprotein n=1 Tax=Chitinophaga skermanii TaxID=331697 RepID=A0A327QKV9_9BACT|nr:NAD(P)/FAD-dependent oxidoreductase [Chitinophaga skermanii]RAJ05286.1 hypothetical protein LX64_02443 [Chitinophaga skermanii]